MIVIFMQQGERRTALSERLRELGLNSSCKTDNPISSIRNIYANPSATDCVIAEASNSFVPQTMWLDILEGLAKRMPVLVVGAEKKKLAIQSQNPHLIFALKDPDPEAIVRFINSCGVQAGAAQLGPTTIPIFSPAMAEELLLRNGHLAVLSFKASDFNKVSTEYGSDVYHQLGVLLEKILLTIHGKSGAFRRNDFLCRRSFHSATFYIILERRRQGQRMTNPGDLERLSDRLAQELELLLWDTINRREELLLPRILKVIPRFIVGYAATVYNPCINTHSQVENLFRRCRETAKIQKHRAIERQKELIQALIQAEDLLVPNYQAVFATDKIPDAAIPHLANSNALKVCPEAVVAYESLIRTNKEQIVNVLGKSYAPMLNYLNPQVLFAKAEEVKLKLEFDQACFRLAFKHFTKLRGSLYVNILPRNIYNLEQLDTVVPDDVDAIFEISESEAISNMPLIEEIRDYVAKTRFKIAIDDFGSGYAGVERIIRIQPNIVKLDRSLINRIEEKPKLEAFLRGLLAAFRSTQAQILAEGVESTKELLKLREIGIDLVQGFLLHRPEKQSEILASYRTVSKT